MTGPQKKKKHHVGDTFYKRKYKTKHRARDIDEVIAMAGFRLLRTDIENCFFNNTHINKIRPFALFY